MAVMLTDPNTDSGNKQIAVTPVDQQPSDSGHIMELVQLFKLLADETRLKILSILHRAEELNVLELCKLLNQRQPSVSHHLAVLRVAGLIGMRREGKHNFYHIVPTQFEHFTRMVFLFAAEDQQHIRFGDFELSLSSVNPVN